MAPRVSTRAPATHRTSSSDSDPPPHRPKPDRSPKVVDRRSPRTSHSEPLTQKKLGTRIAGLETQLDQAQGELKILKDQLASAESAKKEAQKQLEKKTIKPAVSVPVPAPVPVHVPVEESNNEISEETDVFEVPIEVVSLDTKFETSQNCDQDEVKVKVKVNDSPELTEKLRFEEAIAVKNEEISSMKVLVEEKEKKLEAFCQENEVLKRELSEALVKEEEMNIKLTQIDEEFKKSKNDGIQLKEKLKEVEEVKEGLETEMKRLRVQTEQWRKAADAAAAILAGGGVERCGSMDKDYGGVFEGFVRLGDESEEGRRGRGRVPGFGCLVICGKRRDINREFEFVLIMFWNDGFFSLHLRGCVKMQNTSLQITSNE
ncbi:hypothetical protein L1987_31705 [Smallanthus sonchifolius]|uniref:Uncharacterized protein n=1 Tax=Smallanthus sonchifolius TaxID=185202 RepID=A0ACB9I6B3_9ASTR|nr:hypothetical protein L1987_31705 [Smallanthus sonchifolius]